MQVLIDAAIDFISGCFHTFLVYIVAAVELPQSGVVTNCLIKCALILNRAILI